MTTSTSQNPQILCGVCSQRHAIYTCPRCATRSCSLSCSKSHKAALSCSGERDRTAYVPMNKYGWGTMANDYTYLEEVSRKAAEWGVEIAKGSFSAGARAPGRGRGHVHGRTRGKRDILKMQLDSRDIDMDVLPPGMERRRANQSTWDAKSKSLLLTVEFIFHPANDALAPNLSRNPAAFTLLTHRNRSDVTISDAICRHIRERGKKDVIPPWVKSMVSASADEADPQMVCLLAQHSASPSDPVSKVYHKLDTAQTFTTALRNKAFVEYPTIDVWMNGDFMGAFIDTDGTYIEGGELSRPVKRRRSDAVAGQKMMESLLGGYGSEEEEEARDHKNVMEMLGSYESDEQPEDMSGTDIMTGGDSEDHDAVDGSTLGDVPENIEKTGQEAGFTRDQIHWSEEDEEDPAWSDSADDGSKEPERTP